MRLTFRVRVRHGAVGALLIVFSTSVMAANWMNGYGIFKKRMINKKKQLETRGTKGNTLHTN